jgi:triosephosphate isomerase
MQNPFRYIANWKMNFSHNQTLVWCQNHYNDLQALSKDHTLILCPIFTTLPLLVPFFKKSSIKIGAQNCAAFARGSYTGEVSARSLAETGCTYCIIGHQERRAYFKETNEVLIQKIILLQANNITPILCIGENHEDKERGLTYQILEGQLQNLLAIFNANASYPELIIAYEPVWSIGSHATPSYDDLEKILTWLASYLQQKIPSCSFKIVYGGNVNAQNSIQLKQLSLDGFLIGRASLDFQELKKIVL